MKMIQCTKPKVSELRQFLWHGTKGQNLENILKEGLKVATQPKMGASQQFAEYYFDGLHVVCLTNHEGNGCFYATASYPHDAVGTKEFLPIVLQIDPDKLDKTLLVQREKSDDNAYQMYRGANEFDYHSNIPVTAIVGILKWNETKRKYEYFKIEVDGNE